LDVGGGIELDLVQIDLLLRRAEVEEREIIIPVETENTGMDGE
jgi:hypothetical protein